MMPLCLPGQSERVLSVFDYATTEVARAAWKPSTGVSPVGLFHGIAPVEKPGVRFPCNFSSVESRCYWDRTLSEDFTNDTLITLRVSIGNPEPISSLTLYFRSGGGWYSNTFRNLQRGWQELRCARANFIFSGTPTGWHSIDGIRFSPWKGESTDTEIIATELRLLNPAIRVVWGTKSTAPDTANATAALIGTCLDAWGIDYGALTEEDVEEGALAGARLAIFPYSNSMTAAEIARIESFVAAGGKIIVFFTAPTPVFNLLGIRNQGSSGIAPKAMRFRPGIVDCVPSFVKQASWNFFKVALEAPDARVLAEWEDADGTSLGWPAWTLSNNGAYMSHILLDDDLETKKRLMLALAVHFVPEIAAPIARKVLDAMGRIGEYVEFDEAVAAIRASALETPRLNRVEAHLTSATLLRASALDSPTSKMLCEQLEILTGARENLLEAYYRAQNPRTPELRGAWASYNASSGPFVEGWDKMALDLSRNGFNAVMPYLATGGIAHYASNYLPRSDVFDVYGDHIAACVRACKPRGIETHVRKLNYFLYYAPQSFVDDLRAQRRTQVDVDGNPVGSLCPSHPLNYELEMNVMLEIIDNYDIDGIHYDFIRYPDEKCCYCDGCRERFQVDTGNVASDWPTDCYSGALKEPYREWRREQITRLVRGMRNAVNERGRKVKISAAVFSNYPGCRTSVAQDWVAWIEQGYLDFVCPMDYTDSRNRFRSLVASQMEYVAGRVPLCPGVGVVSSSSNLTADQTIAQLLIARQLNADGFVLFVYNNSLADSILPNLRKGLTADPEKNAFFIR